MQVFQINIIEPFAYGYNTCVCMFMTEFFAEKRPMNGLLRNTIGTITIKEPQKNIGSAKEQSNKEKNSQRPLKEKNRKTYLKT